MSKLTEEAQHFVNHGLIDPTPARLVNALIDEIENSPANQLDRWLNAKGDAFCELCQHYDASKWKIELRTTVRDGKFVSSKLASVADRECDSLNATILAALELAEKQET